MSDNFPVANENEVVLRQEQHQYEIAKLNIEKSYENNVMWAQHWAKLRLMAYVFSGVALFLVLVFCGIAMYLNKDAIAMEIIKAGIFLTAGGGVGFAIGRKKSHNQEDG